MTLSIRNTLIAAQLAALPAVAVAPTLSQTAASQLEVDWKAYDAAGGVPHDPLPDGIHWSLRITPPFPMTWPPTGDGRVAWYGFAGGMRFGLSDGEMVAAPWARVVASAKGAPKLERLTTRLESIGIHGVRPIAGDELAVVKTGGAAADAVMALAAGTAATPAPLVQRFYCQWARDSGAGEAVKARHPAFFAWLACPVR